MALFTDSLLTDIQSRGETVNGSFLVTFLVRPEPQIKRFREAMEEWFRQVPDAAKETFRKRLTSVKNEEFFQGFAELAFHQLILREGLEIRSYPHPPTSPFYVVGSKEQDCEFNLSVASFIPEGHPHYARRAYQMFIDELNKIRHRYRFAVYLRRWLPPEFDPSIVRRALENWFHRLDSDPQGGRYAEYREGGVHVEFSILRQLNKVSDNLVGFNLVPLETLSVLAQFREVLDVHMERYKKLSDTRRPLVCVLFNNDEWSLGTNYIYDFFYGKPRHAFNFETKGGRTELVRDFSHIFSKSIFNTDQGKSLGAVILAEKLWKEHGVDLRLLCCHNPWCRRPLPEGFFADRASLKPMSGASPDEMVIRWTHRDDSTLQLT